MTVNEYLSDDLASDSADEKAISKAIKAASCKKEKKRKLRNPTAFKNCSDHSSNSRTEIHHNQKYHPYQQKFNSQNQTCWSCGQRGHFYSNCHKRNYKGFNEDRRLNNQKQFCV